MAPWLRRRNLGAHRKTQGRGACRRGNFRVPPLSDHPIWSLCLSSPDLRITPRFPPRPPAAGDTEGWGRGKASRLHPLLGPSPCPQCPSQKSCVLSACCGGFDRSRAQERAPRNFHCSHGGWGQQCSGGRISRAAQREALQQIHPWEAAGESALPTCGCSPRAPASQPRCQPPRRLGPPA